MNTNNTKHKALQFSFVGIFGLFLLLIAVIFAIQFRTSFAPRASDQNKLSLASYITPKDGECGELGGSCCAGMACNAQLPNGKSAGCVLWQRTIDGVDKTDHVCALPQVIMDIITNSESPSKVMVKLFTNAAVSAGSEKAYSFSVNCNAPDPSSTSESKVTNNVTMSSPDPVKSDKQVETLTCEYPLLSQDVTYFIQGWVQVEQGTTKVPVDPIYRAITVHSNASSIDIGN